MFAMDVGLRVDGSLLKIGNADVVVDREMNAAMHASTQHLRGLIIPKIPVGVSGMLRNATQAKVTGEGIPRSIVGKVFNPLKYAWPVEDGRRPGRKPPIEPILLWVRRVIAPAAEEALGIAYAIRYKIGKVGTKAWQQTGGRHMFENAFNEGKTTVNRLFERANARIVAELSK